MRPATSWQEKQNCVQNAIGLNWHLFQGFCVIPPPRTVFQKKEHSCSSLSLTPIKLELGMRVRGPDPRTLSDVRKWSESHQQLFILHFLRVEQRHWGVDKTLQLLSSPIFGGSRSLGDNPVWIPSFWAGQRTKPRQPLLAGCEGGADFTGPLGQKLHLSYGRVTTVAKSLKTCSFSNVNNIKMFQ